MKIFCKDRICESNEAVVSVFDHGFLYGMGLFETFRTYGGTPFLLDEHLARLSDGCRQLGIAGEWPAVRVERIVRELLAANGLADGYFRVAVSAGTDILGLPSETYDEPCLIVYVKELPLTPVREMTGRTLQLLKLRRNTPEGGVRLKSFHYMNNILAKRELQTYPWAAGAEGLFLDARGHLAEGIVSNVFFVKGGAFYTPSLDTGILPGITRAFVIELLRELRLPVTEGLFQWKDLFDADEVFLTNSIQEIVPVGALTDVQGASSPVGDGQAGTQTEQLITEYRKRTGGGR